MGNAAKWPQRQSKNAPFEETGWALVDIDLTNLYRALRQLGSGNFDAEFNNLTVDGNLVFGGATLDTVASTVGDPGVDTALVTEQGIREALNLKQNIFNGLSDADKITCIYDAATRRLTITNTDATMTVNGTQVTVEDEVTTAHADTTGSYYFYYEAGNTKVTVDTSPWNITTKQPFWFIYYNTDQGAPKALSLYELHENTWEAIHHLTEHYFHGTKYIANPNALCDAADYTLQPAAPATSDNQFSVSAGEIADEDITWDVTAVPSAGPYSVWYRAGADAVNRWDWLDTPTSPLLEDGSYLRYNQLTGGNWQQTDLATNNYVNMWEIGILNGGGTQDTVLIQGQGVHTKLSDALSETFGNSITWGDDVPFTEFCPFRMWTFKTGASYSSDGKCRIEAVTNLRGIIKGGAAILGTPIGHQTLSNRDATACHPATAIENTTTNFTHILSTADINSQLAFETLDEHHPAHELGGTDQLCVSGLSGLLTDNQNPTAHASDHTDGTDDIRAATAAQSGLATAAQITKLDGIEALADITDATNVATAGAAMAGGAFHDGFTDALADEHIGHSGVNITAGTGLTGGGSIETNLTINVDVGIANNKIVQIDDTDAAENDFAKFTLNGILGRSYTEVRTDINVADGADVTGDNAPQAHASDHTDGTDDIQNSAPGTPGAKGLMIAAQATKLDDIEALADVTDSVNVLSAGAVMITGDQVISGIKTFGAFPIIPASSPTTDYQVAHKKYVDDSVGGSGLYSDYIKCSDVKAAGTSGGTATSGAWRTSVLNTEDSDTGGDCTLSSNQMTIPAGTYRCIARRPIYQTYGYKTRLRNITDGTTVVVGEDSYAGDGVAVMTHGSCVGRFTLAAQKAIELQYQVAVSKVTNGLGVGQSFGEVCVFAVVELFKES